MADFFLICTADSDRQSRAIVNEIYAEMKKRGLLPLGNESPNEAQWSLLDYGTVVVHVFQPEARIFYDLDNYWCDGEEVKLDPISPSAAAQATTAQ